MVDDAPLELELGGILPRLEVCYETWGELSPACDNAILICPSFSSNSHANSHPGDPTPGWWEGMIGPGCPFDTERFFVVCTSLLGGADGTTGPRSIDPETGEPYGSTFPRVSIGDIVAVQLKLLHHLGIDRLYATVGGSMGAMEVLELAIHNPGLAARAIAFSGTDRTRPYTVAIRHIGRHAIRLGRMACEKGAHPETAFEGLRLAREMGTLFYRSREEFNQRFSWHPEGDPASDDLVYEVQRYLNHHGLKAVGKFDLDAYLILSQAMDLHDVWRGVGDRAEHLRHVDTEFLIAGNSADALIPIDEQEEIHSFLLAAGKRSTWFEISSHVGHDAFLADLDQVSEHVRAFLDGSRESHS